MCLLVHVHGAGGKGRGVPASCLRPSLGGTRCLSPRPFVPSSFIMLFYKNRSLSSDEGNMQFSFLPNHLYLFLAIIP